jgi:CRP/FNR family transcriptional regulator
LRPLTRPAGALLVRQGEVPDGAWLVRGGRLLLTSTSAGGDELLCVLRSRGAMVGLESLRGAPADYEAWTLEPAQLCHLSAEALRRWLGDGPSPARALLELTLGELQRTREERVSLARGAVERVARFLRSHTRSDGATLGIEQQLLARVLRMRPETLSRALKRLRAAGAITRGRTVQMLEPSRLARFVTR